MNCSIESDSSAQQFSPMPPEKRARYWLQRRNPFMALSVAAEQCRYEPAAADELRALVPQLLVDETEQRIVLADINRALRLAALDAEQTAKPVVTRQNFTVAGCVRVDPEIGRMASALQHAAEHRIWSLIRAHAGSRSWITRDDLTQMLAEMDITYSRRHLKRLLAKGDGLFWGLTQSGRIYHRSPARVGAALVTEAQESDRSELFETNLPGGRDVWVPVQATLAGWKAYLYAAWHTWRRSPEIARRTLAMLFGCQIDTLRGWEDLLAGDLTVRANYAQSTTGDPAQVPLHATQYMTWAKERRYRWQLVNTYQSNTLQLHPFKGQARRVRQHAGRAAFDQPVNDDMAHPAQAGGYWFDRSHRPDRCYHRKADKLRSLIRIDARLEEQHGRPTGFRQQTMYVWRGAGRDGSGIFEYVPREGHWGEILPDWQPQTEANERVPLNVEYRRDWLGPDHKQAERDYLTYLRAQGELA
jgi:hypothetical protein